MRLFIVALLPLALSGCFLPTPLSLATFGLDAVSYAVSGKTVTDHGISLAMGQDCALIGVLEGEVCDDQPDYAVADAGAILEPLPTGAQIALAGGGDPQVYASARRAAAALGEDRSIETDGALLIADLGAIAPASGEAAGEAGPVMTLTVAEQPPLPRSKPDREVFASFEVVRDVADERSFAAAPSAEDGDGLADLAEIVLRAVGADGDLLLAAAPEEARGALSGTSSGTLTGASADKRREIPFKRPFWTEAGEAPQVAARIDGDRPRTNLAHRFNRRMEFGR